MVFERGVRAWCSRMSIESLARNDQRRQSNHLQQYHENIQPTTITTTTLLSITGTLPDLSNSNALLTLQLHSNNLQGALVGSLSSSLQVLQLDDNALTGSFPDAFLSQDSKIVHLSLSENDKSYFNARETTGIFK